MKPLKTRWFVLFAFAGLALMFYSLSKMDTSSPMTLITVNFENAQYGDLVFFEKIPSKSGKMWDERLRDWLRPEDTKDVFSILGPDLFAQIVNVPVPSVWNIYLMENGKKIFVVKYSIGNDGATYNHVLNVYKNGDISVSIIKKQYKMPR